MSVRSLPAVALLLAALALGLAVRLDGIARTIPTRTYERPLGDDSFYYFSLGRNLASGHGFRVDGVNPTTGFQPLWGVLVALPYLIDPARGIQGAQMLGVLTGMAAFALIFVLTRRLTGSPLPAAASAALWWLLPSSVNASLSGMETTLSVAAALAVFVALDRLHETPTRGRARWLGAALGVAVLARIDLIVLAIAALTPNPFAAFGFCRTKSVRHATPGGRGVKDLWWHKYAIYEIAYLFLHTFLIAALTLVPWALLTAALGKPLLPESGLAVRALIGYFYPNDPSVLAPVHQMALFASQLAAQFYPADGLRALIPSLPAEAFALTALMASVVLAVRDRRLRAPVIALALWWIGVTIAYAVGVRAFWYFDRYALPAAQVGAVVLIACLGRAALRSHWPRMATGVLLIVLALATVSAANGYRAGRYDWLSGHSPPDEGLYRTAQWLNANLPPGTRVGVFQSGLIGYYATVPVINLDGKVNSAARDALASGTMWDYVCAAGIEVVADWPSMIDQLLKARSTGWRDDHLTLVATIEPSAPTISPIEIDRVNCG